MGIVSGIVVYILLWWLVFFAVLPLGVKHDAITPRGHDSGAPANPFIWQKVIATSLIAACLWGGVFWIIASDLVRFRT